MHTKRTSTRKRSFSRGETGAFKVRRILRDIEEARGYGIQLHTISLNDLYSSLKRARKKKDTHAKEEPHKRFVYDPEEDQQFPHDDDGLDELAFRAKRLMGGKRKLNSRSGGKKRGNKQNT